MRQAEARIRGLNIHHLAEMVLRNVPDRYAGQMVPFSCSKTSGSPA